jgi:hypothetical protein
MEQQSLFPRIAIVGGPCGGKSTFVAKIMKYFKEQRKEIHPLVAHEIATLHLNGGITFEHLGDVMFQELVLDACVHQEGQYVHAANAMYQSGRMPAVFFDRGIFDGAAYIGDGNFDDVLRSRGIVQDMALLDRYDAVIQFEVAPPAFFSAESNNTRYEKSHARGVEIERIIRPYYESHPNYFWAGNDRGGFDEKIDAGFDFALAKINNFFSH